MANPVESVVSVSEQEILSMLNVTTAKIAQKLDVNFFRFIL